MQIQINDEITVKVGHMRPIYRTGKVTGVDNEDGTEVVDFCDATGRKFWARKNQIISHTAAIN